jgi:hypothetical protein
VTSILLLIIILTAYSICGISVFALKETIKLFIGKFPTTADIPMMNCDNVFVHKNYSTASGLESPS